MSGVKKEPPKPTWHGTPDNLVVRFIEFARQNVVTQRLRHRREVENKIEDADLNKREALDASSSKREAASQVKTEIEALAASLIDLTRLEKFDDGLIRLMYHRSVIGIRADSKGRLVVHVRIFKPEGEKQSYVGDFELSLAVETITSTYRPKDKMLVFQTDVSATQDWAVMSDSYDWYGAVYGNLVNYSSAFCPLLREGDLVGMVDVAIEQIVANAHTKRDKGLTEEPPRAAWTGIMTGIEWALAQTIEWSLNRPIHAAIKEKTRYYESIRDDMDYYLRRVRSYNTELSRLRAELALINAQADPVLDEGLLREQLRYITSLSGVMGVKFIDDDGMGEVPVFHVRASSVHYGERYDMGDYEIEFRPHSGSAAVVRVNQTRKVRGYNNPYYHPDGESYRSYHNWFCFGTRADDLRRLFSMGEFGEFMHMALNSMNSINLGSEHYLRDYFQRIDMDATWTPVALTTRARRRRRLGFLALNVL